MVRIKDNSTFVPIQEAIRDLKARKKVSFQISTEFGVVDISRKEAIRMLETCEHKLVYLSEHNNGSTVILEYPCDSST